MFCNALIPAFPGAEGHGRYATGGRGGVVYRVTSLDDVASNPAAGTFRYAVTRSGARTIVFAVSGTIHLKASLTISNDNLTIAGQSAPGDGICLADFPVNVSANNVIIRFLRFRMGDLAVTDADGADALGGRGKTNLILDHCSMSWSTDECVSFYGNTNFTLQWCMITESMRLSGHTKGPHGYGGIWGGVNASFHHNLLAHNDSRNPRLGPYAATSGKEYVDLRNNVIYNWGGNACYGGEGMNVNIVNCYYKPGPGSGTGTNRGKIVSIDKKTGLSSGQDFYNINNRWGKFYIDGNVVNDGTSNSICAAATNDNWTYGVYNQFASGYTITQADKDTIKVTTPFDAGVVTTHTAERAYEKVLSFAGCSLKRDTLDGRIIQEARTGTALFKGLSKYNGLGSVTYPAGTVIGSTTLTVATTIDWKSTSYPKYGIIDSQQDIKPVGADSSWSAWPTLTSKSAPADLDQDGMDDEWEMVRGLSETNATDRNGYTLSSEYTNLEMYLNSLVYNITTQELQDAISSVPEIKDSGIKVMTRFSPATGMLNLSSEEIIANAEIFTLSGVLLRTQTIDCSSVNIPLNGWSRGVYLVRVLCAGSDKPHLSKFIII